MSVVTLRGNAHLAIANVGTLGTLLTPEGIVSYYVESEHPTYVFAVTSAALAAFRAGQDYRYWGLQNAVNTPATIHDYTGPRIAEMWYLMIVNYNPAPTAVYYRAPR